MYGDWETQILMWKKIGSFRVTADQKVCNKKAMLFSVSLAASAVGVATAVVRDGHDTGGEEVIDLRALTSDHDHRAFPVPVFFQHGIFIDVGDNVVSVMGQYIEIKGSD